MLDLQREISLTFGLLGDVQHLHNFISHNPLHLEEAWKAAERSKVWGCIMGSIFGFVCCFIYAIVGLDVHQNTIWIILLAFKSKKKKRKKKRERSTTTPKLHCLKKTQSVQFGVNFGSILQQQFRVLFQIPAMKRFTYTTVFASSI